MKTITKKYEVYSFEELSKEAKEKAIQDYNRDDDYPFLTDDLREFIYEELSEKGLKVLGLATTENPAIRPYYSLSYGQGDGLMFEARIEDKDGNIYTIKHKGHYYHERSTEISGENKDGEEIDTKDFEENIYIPICKRVAKKGYDYLEYQQSEEYFSEICDSNEYTFLKDGTMCNE